MHHLWNLWPSDAPVRDTPDVRPRLSSVSGRPVAIRYSDQLVRRLHRTLMGNFEIISRAIESAPVDVERIIYRRREDIFPATAVSPIDGVIVEWE